MEEHINTIKEYDFIRYEIADLCGVSRSKLVPINKIENSVYIIGLCQAFGPAAEIEAVENETAIGFPNAKLIPDWTTLKGVPI